MKDGVFATPQNASPATLSTKSRASAPIETASFMVQTLSCGVGSSDNGQAQIADGLFISLDVEKIGHHSPLSATATACQRSGV
jgi:hypothetical protein